MRALRVYRESAGPNPGFGSFEGVCSSLVVVGHPRRGLPTANKVGGIHLLLFRTALGIWVLVTGFEWVMVLPVVRMSHLSGGSLG